MATACRGGFRARIPLVFGVMRHAAPRKTSGLAVFLLSGAGAVAMVTGFTTGILTGSGAGLSAAGAAGVSASPIETSTATELPAVEPTDATPAASVDKAPEQRQQDASREPAVDWGPPSVDEAWPVDEKGDGCEAPVWPAAAPDARRVLVIGDSLVRNSRNMLETELAAAGWTPTVRCWGAMGTDWGVQQVERARELDQLPDTVVVSLGTNDVWWLHVPMETAIDQMMAALGPNRTVYWVNVWWDPAAYDDLPEPEPVNDILMAKAQEYPNLIVVDIASPLAAALASGEAGWVDGVHVDDGGSWVRTETIIAALGG